MINSRYIDLPWDRRSLYDTYDTYAMLPADAEVGTIAVVTMDTGMWPMKQVKGFYIYSQAGWTYLGDFDPADIRDAYESNPDVNRFSDYYKTSLDNIIADGSPYANAVTAQFTCPSTTAVLDLVVADTSADNTVISVSANVYSNLVFGVVINKTSPTACDVLLIGGLDGFGGLSVGKPVYVSPTGTVTTTVPTSGHMQVIGIAISSTKVSFSFSPNKVILAA